MIIFRQLPILPILPILTCGLLCFVGIDPLFGAEEAMTKEVDQVASEESGPSGSPTIVFGSFLNLEQACKIALRRNPDLAIYDQRTKQADAFYDQRRSDLRPKLEANAAGIYYEESFDYPGEPLQPEEIVRLGLKVTQNLFNTRLRSLLKAAGEDKIRAREERQLRKNKLLADVSFNFIDLLEANAALQNARWDLKLIQDTYQQVEARSNLGFTTSSDLNRWKSEALLAESRVTLEQTRKQSALVRLNRSMAMAPTSEWLLPSLEDLVPQFTLGALALQAQEQPQNWHSVSAELATHAQHLSPALRSVNAGIQGRSYLLKESKRRRFNPEIQAYAEGGYFAHRSETRFIDDDSGDELEVGLTGTIPIYEGGNIKAEQLLNDAIMSELNYLHESVSLDVEEDTRNSLALVASSYKIIEPMAEASELANSYLNFVQSEYLEGDLPLVSLIEARRNAYQVITETSFGKANYLRAHVGLQLAVSEYYDASGDYTDAGIRSILTGASAVNYESK